MPWNADIFLNESRVADAGIWRCLVNNPPEIGDPGIGELSLRVLGKKHSTICGHVSLHVVTPALIWNAF